MLGSPFLLVELEKLTNAVATKCPVGVELKEDLSSLMAALDVSGSKKKEPASVSTGGHRTKPIPIPSSVAVQCIQSFAYVVHYQHACSSIPIINIGDHLGPLRTRPSSLALPPPVTQQYATFRPRIALWSLRQMRGAGWWRAGQRRKCLEGQEGSRVARGARTLSIQPAVAFVWAG